MHTVKIYQLNNLSPTQFARLKTSQQEAAQVWNCCMEMHKQARMTHAKWPGRNELQQATKGHFALHSQTVRMIVHAFLANVETTEQLRQSHPEMQMKYPYKEKRFYPVHWPKQAVYREEKRMALWEYGKDIDYLTHKSKQAHMSSFTGSERGTSSRCPSCGHIHKPKNRQWNCKRCGFHGHRDLVGSVNMHQLAFGEPVEFPRSADVSPSWSNQNKE
jgi:rubrerythrin